MKKIFLILVFVFATSFSVFAQQSDGFFKYNETPYNRLDDPVDIGLYMPQESLGYGQNEPAPIGNGLIILTVLGAGYAIRKRK